jgi:hypothetical protein
MAKGWLERKKLDRSETRRKQTAETGCNQSDQCSEVQNTVIGPKEPQGTRCGMIEE